MLQFLVAAHIPWLMATSLHSLFPTLPSPLLYQMFLSLPLDYIGTAGYSIISPPQDPGQGNSKYKGPEGEHAWSVSDSQEASKLGQGGSRR